MNHENKTIRVLQLSDICKMGDDSTMATELVERTLYALESAFHPCFSLASGNRHLDYKRQENRALFIALFRLVFNMINKWFINSFHVQIFAFCWSSCMLPDSSGYLQGVAHLGPGGGPLGHRHAGRLECLAVPLLPVAH